MTERTTKRRGRKAATRDFPLFLHASGQWAKKIRGRTHYFGNKKDLALEKWLDQKDDLLAGRTPRVNRDGLKLRDLFNHFLTFKKNRLENRELSQRTFDEYYAACAGLGQAFGLDRFVDDLAAEDFEALRKRLAKRSGPARLCKEIQNVRSIFKYAYDAALIDRSVRFGPGFKRPSRLVLRKHRAAAGPRMFEAEQIRVMLRHASVQLKAMILLAINCGFGNADVGRLPKTAIDFKRGWVRFPRPKTGIERRCPLWEETLAAIKESLCHRPDPKRPELDNLVFLTRCGEPWAKETPGCPVSAEFGKLLTELEMKKPRLNFYALRHSFETIAGESRDQVAVDSIMGHVDSSMAGLYRERISDDRLQAVVKHVHDWLFGSERPAITAEIPPKKAVAAVQERMILDAEFRPVGKKQPTY